MEMSLTQGPTLREALVRDFGFEQSKVDLMTDDEVDKELIVMIGDPNDQ